MSPVMSQPESRLIHRVVSLHSAHRGVLLLILVFGLAVFLQWLRQECLIRSQVMVPAVPLHATRRLIQVVDLVAFPLRLVRHCAQQSRRLFIRRVNLAVCLPVNLLRNRVGLRLVSRLADLLASPLIDLVNVL